MLSHLPSPTFVFLILWRSQTAVKDTPAIFFAMLGKNQSNASSHRLGDVTVDLWRDGEAEAWMVSAHQRLESMPRGFWSLWNSHGPWKQDVTRTNFRQLKIATRPWRGKGVISRGSFYFLWINKKVSFEDINLHPPRHMKDRAKTMWPSLWVLQPLPPLFDSSHPLLRSYLPLPCRQCDL